MAHRRQLHIGQLLEWADAHHARTGNYPDLTSGRVWEAPDEKWLNLDASLRRGHRGLPGGWSLAQMLDAFRGNRNIQALPPHSIEEILSWADAHHGRTGSRGRASPPGRSWMRQASGGQLSTPPCTQAFGDCQEGGMSLAQLLQDQRGIVNKRCGPRRGEEGNPKSKRRQPIGSHVSIRAIGASRHRRERHECRALSVDGILAAADEFFARFGRWPRKGDGLVQGKCDETWVAIDMALRRGLRGLRSGSSLARLLAEHRGVRTRSALPPLTIEQILYLAQAHRARTGDWPAISSGPIAEAPGETWESIQHAFRAGRRGLPSGGSLGHLLDAHLGTHRGQNNTPLTEHQILAWADAWYQRHGAWPTAERGDIPESEGDTWRAISVALRQGGRGLPGGMSLAQLLAAHHGVRNLSDVLPLTEEQILAWADAHFARHGKYPTQRSAAVEDAPGETWGAIRLSLIFGKRGLPGGKSLARFLAERRGVRNRLAPPTLSEEQILAWADAHYALHGEWPKRDSGAVNGTLGETWGGIEWALVRGRRGLSGGSSLGHLRKDEG